MELVAASIVASLAYIYAPLLRVHASRRFRARALPTANGMTEYVPEPVELPDDILELVELESEGWAQSELTQRARELYAEHGNWPTVLYQLEHE